MVAGSIAAVNGVNVVLAPLFVKLYEISHPAPFLLNAAILLILLAYAMLEPTLRRAGEARPPMMTTPPRRSNAATKAAASDTGAQ